jgi:hypothetical protein
MIRAESLLPVDVIFTPQWWHRNYGLTFREDFFFDPRARVAGERLMRRALHERFGDLGLGQSDAEDRPVVGPVHLAAGFMASAVLGCRIAFSDDGPPQVIPANLSDEQVMELRVPDLLNTSPMKELVDMMGALEREFGYLEGRLPYELSVDSEWYLDKYQDVAKAISSGREESALSHYRRSGFFEGRLPSLD